MKMKFVNLPLKHIFQGEVMSNLQRFFLILLSLTLLFGKNPSFTISGTVQDSSGLALQKAIVFLFDDKGTELQNKKTNKKGNFKFKKIKPGSYILNVKHEIYSKTSKAVTVNNQDIWEILSFTNTDNSSQILSAPSIASLPNTLTYLPEIRKEPEPEKLKIDESFYDYKMNLEAMQIQIDSLKSVVTAFENYKTMPEIKAEILDLIQVPQYGHRIELQNGTVITGKIVSESDISLTLETQIGQLVLKKEMVLRMEAFAKPVPQLEFLGEPMIQLYPNKQIFSGQIKNIGNRRADFVRVIGHLWTRTTSSAGADSIFVKGTKIKYDTGVISDTALEPNQIANYTLSVPLIPGAKSQYHTLDIHWKETR
jgi:hypothetical protein